MAILLVALEINDERRYQQQGADNAKPKNAIDEVWVDTKHEAGDERNKPGLPPPIDDISKPERAGEDADDKTVHVFGEREVAGGPLRRRSNTYPTKGGRSNTGSSRGQ
jgi:hypothetical protein